MITLNESNYFSVEAMRKYWSVSQFKSFDRCEAAALAEINGEYKREPSTALLIGSMIDSFFTGDYEGFIIDHPELFTKKNELKADYRHALEVVKRIERDPLMMEFLIGEYQQIRTGRLFGVDWKIKIDVLHSDKIVDLKIVKDFNDVYDPGYGWRSWVEYWRYDIQGAIYQRIEQIASGRDEPLPFYLAVATKEKTPDIGILEIPQHILDAALGLVEAKIDRFDLIKSGEVEPIRCGRCDYCKSTKKLTAPEVYEIKEAI